VRLSGFGRARTRLSIAEQESDSSTTSSQLEKEANDRRSAQDDRWTVPNDNFDANLTNIAFLPPEAIELWNDCLGYVSENSASPGDGEEVKRCTYRELSVVQQNSARDLFDERVATDVSLENGLSWDVYVTRA